MLLKWGEGFRDKGADGENEVALVRKAAYRPDERYKPLDIRVFLCRESDHEVKSQVLYALFEYEP